jgi:hypothetical protein
MQLAQRRRQIAYRLKRRIAPGVDNEPIVEIEGQQRRQERRRLAQIARVARRRRRAAIAQKALALFAAVGVLVLAVAIGAFR